MPGHNQPWHEVSVLVSVSLKISVVGISSKSCMWSYSSYPVTVVYEAVLTQLTAIETEMTK